MNKFFKQIACLLPPFMQQEFKRLYFRYLIWNGQFRSEEKEFNLLADFVGDGDWVLDIGANIGYYTVKLSNIVGNNGRVIAFEPVKESFELLAANVSKLRFSNVTLINAAASDSAKVVGMEVPKFETGLDNYYMAHVTEGFADSQVLCMAIDSIDFPNPIKLAKIDTEGHELFVLKGMKMLLERYRPILIIEGHSFHVNSYLREFGYSCQHIVGSPNNIFR